MKWYGRPYQTISLQIWSNMVWWTSRLSSINFTWSILEYFVPYVSNFSNSYICCKANLYLILMQLVLQLIDCEVCNQNFWKGWLTLLPQINFYLNSKYVSWVFGWELEYFRWTWTISRLASLNLKNFDLLSEKLICHILAVLSSDYKSYRMFSEDFLAIK